MDELSETVSVKINKKLRNQLCNVSDTDCILVEFLNREEEEYAIGFNAWLKRQKNDEIDVNFLIESEEQVIMYWPIDLSIQPSKTIRKHLAKANFLEESVILKSAGDWIEMKEQLKSLRSTGKLQVSKSSRKRVMKKQVESPIKHKIRKDKILTSAKDYAAYDQNQDILNKQANVTQERQPWDEIEEVVESDEENSRQKDLDFPRTYDSGFGDSMNTSSTISIPARTNKKIIQRNNGNDNVNDAQSKPIKKKSSKTKTKVSPLSTCATPSPPREQNNSQIINKPHDGSPENYGMFEKNVQKDKRSSAIGSTTQNNRRESNAELPAGVKRVPPLSDSIIKMCLAKKKIQSFVSGLIDNFFEKSYLAQHSPTGQTPNAFVALNIVPKPALHPEIVAYIRDLVEKHFGSQVGVQGKVTKAISDKIASARPKKKTQASATATTD